MKCTPKSEFPRWHRLSTSEDRILTLSGFPFPFSFPLPLPFPDFLKFVDPSRDGKTRRALKTSATKEESILNQNNFKRQRKPLLN